MFLPILQNYFLKLNKCNKDRKDINKHATCIFNSGKLENTLFASETFRRSDIIALLFFSK